MNHRAGVLTGCLVSVICAAGGARAGAPEGKPAVPPPGTAGSDVTSEFEVPDGLRVTVWAATPSFFNPTNIDVDHRGRIWVAEGVNYRFSVHKHRAGWPIREGGDRIMILEDRDGDGTAESSKVFVQDKDLTSPLGIAVFGNRVVVSASPSVFVYTDEDGDDKADKKEVFLTGFGGHDHDHGVHAISAGPDGRWYFTTGNEGPHNVTDKAGFTLRKFNDNPHPDPPRSDDGRIWIMGVILRIGPDGKGLGVLAHNFRNNYEVALDSFGNMFQNDNDDDGNESCRFTHVFEGGNYGFASADAQRGWRMDQREGQEKPIAHWHQEDPGVVPPTEVTGAGAPTGLVIYEGGLLPERYVGMALNADSGRRTVWGHKLTAQGAGFTSARMDFLKAKVSPANGGRGDWFRPSDVAVGPDGAIYVSDWYDATVGGHATLDSTASGRILRIAPAGARAAIPPLDPAALRESPDAAVAALMNPAVNVRHLGWSALRAQGDKALPALTRLSRDPQPRRRARSLWLLAAIGGKGKPLVERALSDQDPDIRLTAFRALRAVEPTNLSYGRRLLHDRSPSVRRELALALRDVPAKERLPLLLTLARQFDGRDRNALEAIGIGAQGQEDALYSALAVGVKTADAVKWPPAFAAFAWRLHPVAAIPGLRARADAVALPESERQKAVVALAFINHADAVRAVMEIAESPSHPMGATAARLAAQRGDLEWKSFGVGERLAAARKVHDRAAADPKIDSLKAELHKAGLAPARKSAITAELATSAGGGMFLIGEAIAKKLDEATRAAAAEKIFANPDPSVRALASRYFERPSFSGVRYPSIAELTAMKGDAEKGRAVFLGPTAACTLCHEMQGKGRNVGPALTTVGGKLGREALFDAILNPSAGIAFGYNPWVVVTKDGQAVTGFILADGDALVLRDTAGETRFLPKGDIVQRERQPGSIMPDNIALGMKPQELVDLVEFLSTRR